MSPPPAYLLGLVKGVAVVLPFEAFDPVLDVAIGEARVEPVGGLVDVAVVAHRRIRVRDEGDRLREESEGLGEEEGKGVLR